MLLYFKMKNFKSFYDETEISMIANSAQKDFKERLINVTGKENVKKSVIPAMVIYGANASGKTSIISAINLLKQIIINGTIKKQIKNTDIKGLDIYHFIHDYKKSREPIQLEITFKTDENIYNYLIGIVASYNTLTRKIINEELNIVEYKKVGTSIKENIINVYKRLENSVELNKDQHVINLLYKDDNFINDIERLEKNFSENLDKEDLFLTTGFKSMISLKVSNDILNWFQEKLITIIDFDLKETLVNFNDFNDNAESVEKVFKNKALDRLVRIADFGPQEIGYMKDDDTGMYVLKSFYKPKGINKGLIINSKMIESKGTMKLIDFWLDFMEYFNNGGIFILDEFDCSIHPELISGIIDLFNNAEINRKNAQLIFNTHNPLYLQKKFFRRDQIMFVEKDETTYMSSVYKLSDIELRNDADYFKRYFEGKFGALPFIDFESALNEEKGAE